MNEWSSKFFFFIWLGLHWERGRREGERREKHSGASKSAGESCEEPLSKKNEGEKKVREFGKQLLLFRFREGESKDDTRAFFLKKIYSPPPPQPSENSSFLRAAEAPAALPEGGESEPFSDEDDDGEEEDLPPPLERCDEELLCGEPRKKVSS